MSDKDKQRTLAQAEFVRHEAEYTRLQRLADLIIGDMEYHSRQMETWNEYLGSLVTEQLVAVPMQSERHLRLVPNTPA